MSAPTQEPLSWRALQWIKSRMAAVTPDAGYYSDFSDAGTVRLLDDRTQIDAEAGSYVLVVGTDFEPGTESGTRNRAVYREDMGLLVEFGIARDPALSPELAIHRARTDVLRALRQDIRAADAGITQIQITGSTLGDAPDGAALLIAQVTARASLTDTTPPAI
jgi:hypothetical protein